MARKKEARLTASEDEPQCQNGAPIFVEMIAEARAYPSAVYQGIHKLPGSCSCPCLKTLPIPAQRPPAPGPQVFGHFGRRSRDKEDRASPSLCRSSFMAAQGDLINRSRLITAAVYKSGYIVPHNGTQWCCDSSAKQPPHALSHVRSEVLRDRHIRVKPPLSGEKKEDNISATERLPSGDRGTSVGRLTPRCVRPETTSGGNGSNGSRRSGVSVSASGVSFGLREAVIDGYVLYRLFYGLPRMDLLDISFVTRRAVGMRVKGIAQRFLKEIVHQD
ncbi:hypothetical protein FOC1_g10011712 [Fusarium oxysporum f. sp. cubense race 1]|uniref:Uncharacterized protein n=1 Tax=Fusarium oxysporum f. sp. cubense (strain race 1) TaxID=1229664 RepID=N4U0K4_FUSC1|nr:hypothetical protein FOC1_g10011712 [Fusarium oxysporum f. sp. cubense race 1]